MKAIKQEKSGVVFLLLFEKNPLYGLKKQRLFAGQTFFVSVFTGDVAIDEKMIPYFGWHFANTIILGKAIRFCYKY